MIRCRPIVWNPFCSTKIELRPGAYAGVRVLIHTTFHSFIAARLALCRCAPIVGRLRALTPLVPAPFAVVLPLKVVELLEVARLRVLVRPKL